MQVFSSKIANNSWLRYFAKVLVSASLIAYCLSLVSINDVAQILKQVDFKYLFLALIFTLIGTVICKSYMVWHVLCKVSTVKFSSILKINLVMRFYTIILPKAMVAVIRWNKYRKVSNPSYALVLVSFDAIVALLVASLMTIIFICMDDTDLAPLWLVIAAVTVLIFLIILLGVFFLPKQNRIVTSLLAKKHKYRIINKLFNLYDSWEASAKQLNLTSKSTLLTVSVSSLLGHILFIFGAYFLLLSINIDFGLSSLGWIRSAVFVLVSIPISMAGVGVREVGFIALFGLYGIPADVVISYALLALLVQFAIGILGMVIEINEIFKR